MLLYLDLGGPPLWVQSFLAFRKDEKLDALEGVIALLTCCVALLVPIISVPPDLAMDRPLLERGSALDRPRRRMELRLILRSPLASLLLDT